MGTLEVVAGLIVLVAVGGFAVVVIRTVLGK